MTTMVLGGLSQLLSGIFSAGMVPQASGFSWFSLVPGFSGDGPVAHLLAEGHDAWVIITSWVIVALILGAAVLARMGLNNALAKTGPSRLIPDAGLTPRNLFEILVEGLYELVEGIVGAKEARAFFPLVATLFVYILLNNLAGLIPGVLPPTENFSNNFALACMVFLVFNYAGLSRNGFAYVKHLGGPIRWMFPFMFFLEGLGLFIRPVSLTIRLTANIFADHLVSGAVRELGDNLGGALAAVLLPAPLYFLGLFVCVVQAFVFSLLTTIYIGLSTADMHHHDHNDHH